MSSASHSSLGGYKERVIVAGCGRSGTTWLARILNYLNEYRVLFEPFHSANVNLVSHFYRHQYLRPDNHQENYYEPVRRIMTGAICGPWVDKMKSAPNANRLIVKDIFCLLLLRYIKSKYPTARIIYLIRHPCAVAQSRQAIQMGSSIDCFMKQPELLEDYLNPFTRLLRYQEWSEYQKSILLWCVLNYVGLRQIENEDACVVFYEHLWLFPEVEIARIWSYLGETYYLPMVVDAMKKPSDVTSPKSAAATGGNPVESWRQHLNDQQIRFTSNMLYEFGLGSLYGYESVPDCEAAEISIAGR